ncbi:hypothetical protein CCACVL1_02537, partial [Corchorus capsularis]
NICCLIFRIDDELILTAGIVVSMSCLIPSWPLN